MFLLSKKKSLTNYQNQLSCKTSLNICATYTFVFPLGTKCAVQMPHWLSWAPTSNLNPSLNLKNGSLLTTRDREEECLASPPLRYNVTYCLYLPLFFFASLVTPFSFMHPIPTHAHPSPRPGHRTNSDPSLCLHSFFPDHRRCEKSLLLRPGYGSTHWGKA